MNPLPKPRTAAQPAGSARGGQGEPTPEGLAAVYLQPGEHLATLTPTVVTTVLGSCVAVCLWDPRQGIGGMNHYLLPYWYGGPAPKWRFGTAAVDGLADALLALGSRRQDLQAKVFGGARLLAARRPGQHDLGSQNVAVGLEALAARRIPVEAQSVGGSRGRKLVFHTHDGSAWVKLL